MIFFDLETTGVNPDTDHICQFYALRDDGHELHFLCDPEMPVSTEASRANGYTWTDLKAHPPFKHFARQVQELFTPDQTIVGYNSRNFDTLLLHNELRRVGERGLLVNDLDEVAQPEIDIFMLWLALERRTLEGCARRFGVNIPPNSKYHDARTDVKVLPKILLRMEEEFDVTAPEMMALILRDEVDRAGKFRRRQEDGVIVFNFGKFRDGPAKDQPGYLRWMLERGTFHPSTLEVARTILREKGQLA